MLLALLGLHVVLAGVAPTAARRLGPRVLLLCALAPAATAAYAAAQAPGILDGQALTYRVDWAPALGLGGHLRLDAFALAFVALISGVGTAIFCYAAAYFHERPDLGRFAAVLTAFAGSMLGLVWADNLLWLYVFWELTSVTSYLLIGFEDRKGSARAAALQALLTTSAGGLVMLAGFVLLGQAAGTYQLSALLSRPPSGATVTAGLWCVLVGAFTKSAQAPFHMWLPGAMAAPTPVSAYLHSATMVKAGVYLIARFAPVFALQGASRPLVVGVGVATMLLGGWRALRQHDLKLLLAFGTVSQLGFLVVLFGAGEPELTTAGVVLLLAHGLFKAALFLVVGVVDHQAGTRDLRRLSGLGRRMPAICAVAAVAAASMAGLPPLFGFVSKEAAYDAFLHADLGGIGMVALAGVVAGSVLTFAYSVRFVHGAFADKPGLRSRRQVGPDVPHPSAAFAAPAAILALGTVGVGALPAVADGLVTAAAVALDGRSEPADLALWHGLTPALGLSVLTLAAGCAVVAGGRRLARLQDRLGGRAGSQEAYAGLVRGLNDIADRTTGVLQNGSLPTYLATILVTVVAVPGVTLLARASLPNAPVLAESPVQVAVGIGIMVAAVCLIGARRRFAAVLFLGAVGYGVSLLFVLQGAPDLALTQFLIETLSLVLFVLVLRHLPDRFTHYRWPLGQTVRVGLSALVGAFVFVFALVAGTARTAPSVSRTFLEQALPAAGGRNVVNVILVDFRGFDTFGEITVLLVAALGVAALVQARRSDEDDPR